MGLKERMAMKAAEKLIQNVNKKDFLKQLRQEIEKQGLTGLENMVDAAEKRIEASGMKKIFDKLGITRADLEEAFADEKQPRQEAEKTAHEEQGGPEQEVHPQNEN